MNKRTILCLTMVSTAVLTAWSASALGAPAGAKEPTHEFFTTSDGIKLHYMRLGDHGSYVVLIHGYTGSAQGNWFDNGIAQALAKNHRVVAIDNRNHGRSDKPQLNGAGKAEDTLELMDHLKIEKAHIHGYSMGGAITGRLLATHPERFLSAAFGGSGITETDPEWLAKLPPDKSGVDPGEAALSKALRIHHAMDNGMSREEAEKLAEMPPAPRPAVAAPARGGAAALAALQIDLTKVTVPVLAINGELDRPRAKTTRMARELFNFSNIVLPGKSHLTAIVAGAMPKEYVDGLVGFINSHDQN
jgi:pimeloyl-ACP methyl ester carboxylesterase